MLTDVLPVAIPSAALFCGLTVVPDRKMGAVLSQAALVLAAAMFFVAIVVGGAVAGLSAEGQAAIATGLMAAAVAGMLYHLYLGRFSNVWAARGVFTLFYLVTAGLFGFVLLSLF